MLCEGCGKESAGKTYCFYVGKSAGSYTTQQIDQQVTTTYYKDIEQKKAFLCNQCAKRTSKEWAGIITLCIIGSGLLFLTVLLIRSGDETHLWFGLLSGFLALIALGFFGQFIFVDENTIGQDKAISLVKRKYQRQGFDSFWNVKERFKLKRH